MGDASKADNWNGVQIVITWDCVFTCPVYNGMIDNLARTSDNHLIILITSARLLKDAVERDLHGTTREEYLKQRFEILLVCRNCRRKPEGKAFHIKMTGGIGSDTIFVWALRKKHSDKTKKLETLVRILPIVNRAKSQLG